MPFVKNKNSWSCIYTDLSSTGTNKPDEAHQNLFLVRLLFILYNRMSRRTRYRQSSLKNFLEQSSPSSSPPPVKRSRRQAAISEFIGSTAYVGQHSKKSPRLNHSIARASLRLSPANLPWTISQGWNRRLKSLQ